MSHVRHDTAYVGGRGRVLATVGSTINTANTNAAVGTTGVQPPGGDSVSAFVVALFAAHAQAYQAAGAQAATYHNQFVQALRMSAGSYASTEATNASPLQKVSDTVSAASQTSAGHLIDKGVNGAAGHLIDNGATGAAQLGGVNGPLPGSGSAAAPSSGTPVAAGPVASGGDSHAATVGGPQGGSTGGGGANGVLPATAALRRRGWRRRGWRRLADPRGAGGWAVGANGAAGGPQGPGCVGAGGADWPVDAGRSFGAGLGDGTGGARRHDGWLPGCGGAGGAWRERL